MVRRPTRSELEAGNPIKAENHVFVECYQIDPMARFRVPKPWQAGVDVNWKQSNPIGVENHVMVDFYHIDPIAGFKLPRPQVPSLDVNSKTATPSGLIITFWSNSTKSTHCPVSVCLGRAEPART